MILAGTIFRATMDLGSDTPVAATPTPTSEPTSTGARSESSLPVRLATREADPRPLTLDEVFRDETLRVDGRTYLRTRRAYTARCRAAVVGKALRSALRARGCTQVLRASYRENGRHLATLGVGNLPTKKAATRIVRVVVAGKGQFVRPLAARPRTKGSKPANGIVGAKAHGHYAVLIWVQDADGSRSGGSRKALSGFARNLFHATVAKMLHLRRSPQR